MSHDIAECKYCVYQGTSVGGYESRCEYTAYCMKVGATLKQCYYGSKCEKCSQYEKAGDKTSSAVLDKLAEDDDEEVRNSALKK